MAKILRVHYASDFRKSYKKLPRNIQNLVDRKDKIFRENPFHPSLQTHKLHGPHLLGCGHFRYRVITVFCSSS